MPYTLRKHCTTVYYGHADVSISTIEFSSPSMCGVLIGNCPSHEGWGGAYYHSFSSCVRSDMDLKPALDTRDAVIMEWASKVLTGYAVKSLKGWKVKLGGTSTKKGTWTLFESFWGIHSSAWSKLQRLHGEESINRSHLDVRSFRHSNCLLRSLLWARNYKGSCRPVIINALSLRARIPESLL